MSRIAIVVLDRQRDDFQEDAYHALSVEQQLQRLEAHIVHACEALKIKEPNVAWIITWREHGVIGEPYLSAVEKILFKRRLAAITAQYPQLTIIAGTIKYARSYYFNGCESGRTRRHQQIEFKRKYNDILAGYRCLSWLRSREIFKGSVQYQEHVDHVEANAVTRESIIRTVVRNVSYVFQGGQCVARHDKTAPWREVNEVSGPQYNTIFQCGKGRNKPAYVALSIRDDVLPVGIEICREHAMGVLEREVIERQVSMPVLHFVLSDSIDLRQEYVSGQFVVHADSKNPPGLYRVISTEQSSEVDPVLYSSNLLQQQPELSGPCAPKPIRSYIGQARLNMHMSCD